MTTAAAPGLLHQIFERSAADGPHRVAVDVPPGRLHPTRHRTTYGELDAEANAIAHRLAPFVHGECIVAVLLPRHSARIYAAQLGIMKAGAAYTCFDLAFPDDRLRDTVEDAQAVALLTDAPGRARALAAGFPADRIIDVVEAHHEGGDTSPVPTPSWLTPNTLAYVIYTSGTTGKPKGVMIEHRSIVNLVLSDVDYLKLGPDDRCVQGSSAAYDSSVEELWLAFAVGATMVVMDDETARLGPDLIPWLREERATVFCPPPTQLRASGCEDPGAELPDLKWVYLGGEAAPQDLVDRWAAACNCINGYGPTETTVTVTRVICEPGREVTIGTPLRNVTAYVVDEQLNPLPLGTQGELVIGGIAVARGYWNKPELTAERFPTHPEMGRVYRTGDIASIRVDGEILYFGRGDAQVKLRGYRVELGAIEEALAGIDGVRAAACTVQGEAGRQTLIGFIVPEAMVPMPDTAFLQAELKRTLPEYMVPSRFAPIEKLPVSISGKLDRRALPVLEGLPITSGGEAPTDDVERAIAECAQKVLRHAALPGIRDDFFTALGGDSLAAAELVSALRARPDVSAVDVRDVYEARTIAGIAERVRERMADSTPEPVPTAPVRGPHMDVPVTRTTLVQAMTLARSLIINSTMLWLAAFKLMPWILARTGVATALLLAPLAWVLAALVWAPIAVWMTVMAKKRLVGTYQPSRIVVWSPAYLKHWLVQQSAKSIPWNLLEGTVFQIWALRALGAKIGERVHIHHGVILARGGWDLLEIGNDVTFAQDAALRVAELEDGHIVFERVVIGNGVTLGIHAGVGGSCVVGDGAVIADNASVSRGAVVGANELWDGLPAKKVGKAPVAPTVNRSRDLSPFAFSILELTARLVLSMSWAIPTVILASFAISASGLSEAELLADLLDGGFGWKAMLIVTGIEVVATPLRLVIDGLMCRLMGRAELRTYSVWEPAYLRLWLKPMIIDGGSRWLYGTLFWPYFLRLCGMKVGKDCEISSLIDTVPETVSIGSHNFFADGQYLGHAEMLGGTATIKATHFGDRIFLGNGVIIPPGMTVPDDVLLGINTKADPERVKQGTAWFGHPAFELPRREVVEFDEAFTFDPGPVQYAVRVFWELMRFVVAGLPVVMALLWFKGMAAVIDTPLIPFILLVAPAVTLGAGALFALSVILIKWVMLGKVTPAMHPLWSSWASRWDLMCLVWNICAGGLVGELDGTLMLNGLLRLTGVQIGKRVVLGSGFAEDLPDPDMLTFEDGATIDCLFQAHTFEDRVLKMDKVTIRAGATVAMNSVLLYGTDIGTHARVAPHSVVVKHESLRPGLTYAGFPTRPAADQATW